MNLRNAKGDYNIGLDLGTGSVGWAVADEQGDLCHFKSNPTWGSRLFDTAQTAAEARIPRGQRRRYVRRRWRLNLLQDLFKAEVEAIDPEFFIRLKQSRLHEEDRETTHSNYRWPLFNGSDFNESDYYKKFPTIYHLRKWLMETPEKADIRLIYLAAHNIIKHRGNFLRQENKSLSSKNANAEKSLEDFYGALGDWCANCSYELGMKKSDQKDILKILSDSNASASHKRDEITKILKVEISELSSENKACNKQIASAMVGLSADFKKIFTGLEAEKTKIYLSKDEEVEALREYIPDESKDLFEAIYAVYSAYVLQGLLSYVPGASISVNMVAKYDKYSKDLRNLKDLVRDYTPKEPYDPTSKKPYDSFFRGEKYLDKNGRETKDYDASKAQGYTRYNLGVKKLSYEDFRKEVENLLKGTAAIEDSRYVEMMDDFANERFLRRLKTSDNGSICYQLHLEELHAILENQAVHYPFLKSEQSKIESLVEFRIPYYVGPLSSKNAAVDYNGKKRFAWAVRKPGMENATITPWNWDEVIDKGVSAQEFIERMTGECTYLQGEAVLPRCSLLYEEFCMLNELNGSYWSEDGDKNHRFDAADREGIVQDLFKKKRKVNYKDVASWMERQLGHMNVRVKGGQGESSYVSKLSSYIFFCKEVFKTEELDFADYPMIENIILWSTLFEDRSILKEKLSVEYGDRLTETQIKAICKKRFTGWGKLSKKLLVEVKVQTDYGMKSVMDIMREGNPNAGTRNNAMVLMQVLRDENLCFQQHIDEINKARFKEIGKSLQVNELPGSPALRRGINQAIRIVDEIVSIAGRNPSNIFIEVTRDDETQNKGKRTKRRYNQLYEATQKFKDEFNSAFDPTVLSQLTEEQGNLDDERLMLYFAQHGKCLYSGKPISLSKLFIKDGEYEVDHIIPRSYIKDDSLENKALVYRSENQRKTDEMLIDKQVRVKMSRYWRMLHDSGLIGDKKYRNLLRDHIDDKAMKGFIARQLVETSQIMKLVQQLLAARYPNTKIVPVKAGISHDLRDECDFIKSRQANDFHHAHDAYLACRVGMFIQMRHPKVYENPIGMTKLMRDFARTESKKYNHDRRLPGGAGFLVKSFMSSGFNPETGEIFKDAWNAELEIEGIRKALNYRQCYISRMPYEDAGTFWDATIYSPKDPKMGPKLALPLKRGLDPQKYGGYSSQKFAYFFVYEALNKKGKRVFEFAEVPVWLAPQIKKDKSKLEEYARSLATEKGFEFVAIERAKILKRQLIEIDGDRLIITGKKEMRNARELAFSQEEMACFQCIEDSDASIEEKAKAAEILFDRIYLCGNSVGARLHKQLGIDGMKESFSSLEDSLKPEVVSALVASLNGVLNMVNLSAVGGGKCAGCLQPNYSKILSDKSSEFVIIDQSVTGMFERRTRIGL